MENERSSQLLSCHISDLQDPYMPYNYGVNKVSHDSIDFVVVERKRHASIVVGASSSSVPTPPPPSLGYMPQSQDTHVTHAYFIQGFGLFMTKACAGIEEELKKDFWHLPRSTCGPHVAYLDRMRAKNV
ncbi:hypothetical protein FXO38_25709 [Capsicum annuum]|nr:hypothetical protein FXO37_28811 [Capsicum annuum]KAF3633176.1 hypothetical protein FXO38_25709 [Capsicum annuum]